MCRVLTADLWLILWNIHVIEINFIGKLQGASVFMFSKRELFLQVFLKDIGLRCRKFIIQNRTFADQCLVAACDVLDLFVFVSYWGSHTLFQRSFLEMFTSQATVAYCFFFTHCCSGWLFSLCEDLMIFMQHYYERFFTELLFDLYGYAASYF